MAEGKALLGKTVLKKFEKQFFEGVVKAVHAEAAAAKETDAKNKTRKLKTLYHIKYEDGDEEDVYIIELRKLIAAAEAEATRKAECKATNDHWKGKQILTMYKRSATEATVQSAELPARGEEGLIFKAKRANDSVATFSQEEVIAGHRQYNFEMAQQASLEKQRKTHCKSKVAKNFEGKFFTGTVTSVGREDEKPAMGKTLTKSKTLFHVKYSDGDEEDVYLNELRELKKLQAALAAIKASSKQYKGVKFTKVFGEEAFDGEVIGVDLEIGGRKPKPAGSAPTLLYNVKYPDGDEEDLYEKELEQGIALFKSLPAAKWNAQPAAKKRKPVAPKKKKAAKKLPAKRKRAVAKPTRASTRIKKSS